MRRNARNLKLLLEILPDLLIEDRQRLGITQQQIADRLGVAVQVIQKQERRGYRLTRLDRLMAIARALEEIATEAEAQG